VASLDGTTLVVTVAQRGLVHREQGSSPAAAVLKAIEINAKMVLHVLTTSPADPLQAMIAYLQAQQQERQGPVDAASQAAAQAQQAGSPTAEAITAKTTKTATSVTTSPATPPEPPPAADAVASPLEAFFETLGLHRTLAREVAAGGVTTLEQLAGAGKAALQAAVQQAMPALVELLCLRASRLQFTKVAEEAARAGNRRDFMVALPERVGDAAADAEQQVAPEVQKLFDANPGAIKDGRNKVCDAPAEYWRFVDAAAYPGMGQEENRLMQLFKHAAKPLALSMQRKEPTYANVLHRGYAFLAQRGAAAGPADDLYCAQHTFQTSLENQDGGWANVLEPDETGFKGFTSFAPTSLTAWDASFWKEGGFAFAGGEVTDSPVVRVKSAPPCSFLNSRNTGTRRCTPVHAGTRRYTRVPACSCGSCSRARGAGAGAGRPAAGGTTVHNRSVRGNKVPGYVSMRPVITSAAF